MEKPDQEFLENDKIPESVKVAYLENTFSKIEREKYEPARLRIAGRQLWLGVPVVVALVSVVSVVVTNLFSLLLADRETSRAIELEQIRQQVASDEVHRLQLEEKIRHYEIVARELSSQRSTAERAAAILFLAKIGVLSTLNTAEIEHFARQALSAEGQIPDLTQP